MRPELVRATLEGRKTQTRRLVTMANSEARDDAGKATREDWARMDWGHAARSADGPAIIVPGEDVVACRRTVWRVTPRVRVGDRFWVREPWQCSYARGLAERDRAWVAYKAEGFGNVDGWRPGIHMPRWACRLELEVERVLVQRITEITEDDARAEGVEPFKCIAPEQTLCEPGDTRTQGTHPHTIAFASLWDKINAHRDGAAWTARPWVWAYTYHRKEPTP